MEKIEVYSSVAPVPTLILECLLQKCLPHKKDCGISKIYFKTPLCYFKF